MLSADPALPTAAGLGVKGVQEHADLLDGRRLDRLGAFGLERHDGGTLLLEDGRRLSVTAFTDGGPQAEWPDHPACVGMGLAKAWTAEILGLEVAAPPGVPPLPASLRG